MNKWIIAVFAMLCACSGVNAQPMRQLIDTHIHYSQDAWEMLPTEEAVKVLRRTGLKKAFVSSSSDGSVFAVSLSRRNPLASRAS